MFVSGIGLVVDGCDMGIVVFLVVEVKIFFDVSVEERVCRCFK